MYFLSFFSCYLSNIQIEISSITINGSDKFQQTLKYVCFGENTFTNLGDNP